MKPIQGQAGRAAKTPPSRPRQAGATAVETALVLPLLLLVLFGIIEFGNLLSDTLILRKATEIGARYAVTGQGEDGGTRLSEIKTATENAMKDTGGNYLLATAQGAPEVKVGSWPAGTTKFATSPTWDNPGGPCAVVEVQVNYNYHPVTPIVGALLPDPLPLSRQERSVNEPWSTCP